MRVIWLAHLGAKIATVEDWRWMAAEFPVGREGEVKMADNILLQLRGRIDLVLAQHDAPNFAGQKIWIVDYKTNSAKELKNSDLHDKLVKGDTLQLGLYSLAMRELGAAEVDASILSLAVKNVGPQLSVTRPRRTHECLRRSRGDAANRRLRHERRSAAAFGYGTPYPLATLPIDEEILEDKWALSHPNLVLEKEEWEVW